MCREMDLTSSSIRVTWSGPLPHQTHLNTMFSSLQSNSTLVDVSLICQTGEMVKCHKIVLAAASNLFKRLFVESTGKVRSYYKIQATTYALYSYSTLWSSYPTSPTLSCRILWSIFTGGRFLWGRTTWRVFLRQQLIWK